MNDFLSIYSNKPTVKKQKACNIPKKHEFGYTQRERDAYRHTHTQRELFFLNQTLFMYSPYI